MILRAYETTLRKKHLLQSHLLALHDIELAWQMADDVREEIIKDGNEKSFPRQCVQQQIIEKLISSY